MKQISLLVMVVFSASLSAQIASLVPTRGADTQMMNKNSTTNRVETDRQTNGYPVASLIPFQQKGKYGFKDQNGSIAIPIVYNNVCFFAEECRILNSPNESIRKFGSSDYASVQLGNNQYRIDKDGNKVYTFKDDDLGKCISNYQKQHYLAYIVNGKYGLIEYDKYTEDEHQQEFKIQPEYDMIHVLEGNDLENPMLIAGKGNKFGIIDINNNIIVPFDYADIKRNYSWKLASLFEVSKDGHRFYYIDNQNKVYK